MTFVPLSLKALDFPQQRCLKFGIRTASHRIEHRRKENKKGEKNCSAKKFFSSQFFFLQRVTYLGNVPQKVIKETRLHQKLSKLSPSCVPMYSLLLPLLPFNADNSFVAACLFILFVILSTSSSGSSASS